MSPRFRALRALAVAVAVSLGGCSSVRDEGPVLGRAAPTYAASDLQGDSVDLADLEGKAVLLNFWATWCTPCREETPFLQRLYLARAKEGFVVLGASVDAASARADVEAFVREYGVTYPILLDPQMRGMDGYRVMGLPATFLIDRAGVLRWMRLGPVGEDDQEFLSALEAVLE